MLDINFTSFPILTTDRLTLRQLSTADDQEIFMLRSDNEVNKYLNRQPSKNIEDARNFINIVNENIDKNQSLYWAIALNNNDKIAGTICLFDFSDKDNKCEIGFELLPNFQQQGIMKEAALEVIEYAFNTIQVQKLEAFVHSNNAASIKLLEKLSFKRSNEFSDVNVELLGFELVSPVDKIG